MYTVQDEETTNTKHMENEVGVLSIKRLRSARFLKHAVKKVLHISKGDVLPPVAIQILHTKIRLGTKECVEKDFS